MSIGDTISSSTVINHRKGKSRTDVTVPFSLSQWIYRKEMFVLLVWFSPHEWPTACYQEYEIADLGWHNDRLLWAGDLLHWYWLVTPLQPTEF